MTIVKTQQAAEQLDLARAAFDAQMFDVAAAHVKRLLEIDPSMTAARILEARLKLQQNQPRQALAALDANGLYNPDHQDRPELAMLRVQGLIGSGSTDLALTELDKLTEAFPDDVRAYRMIASLAMKADMTDHAVRALENVVRLEPADRPARMNLARLLAVAKPQAAITLLERNEYKTDLGVRLQLARLYHSAGRDREAEETYAALLDAAPDEETIWREAGELADSLGSQGLAVRRLRHAVELSAGKSVESWTRLAITRLHAGQVEQAGRCWWRVTRLDPANARAWAGLVICALEARRLGLVRGAQKTLTVQTSKRERQRLLAELWQHLAGGMAVQHALCGEDAPWQTTSPLQHLLTRAAATMEQHVQKNPTRADAHHHLAVCRAALNDGNGASAAVTDALAINPDYAAAVRLRARLRLAA